MGEAKNKLNFRQCSTCVFATMVPGQGMNVRHCRRVPPISSPLIVQQARPGLPGAPPTQAIQFMSAFPTVRPDDWCGEFQPRQQVAGQPISAGQNGEGGDNAGG